MVRGRIKNPEECERISLYLPKKQIIRIDAIISKSGIKSRNKYFEQLINNSALSNPDDEIKNLERQEAELTERISKIKDKKIKLMDVNDIYKEIEAGQKINKRKAIAIIQKSIVDKNYEAAKTFSTTWSVMLSCSPEELLAEAYGGLKYGR